MSIFLSIIIPVYNVEPYLDRSIGSLFEQKNTDIEILAIDDGSTDGSKDKLRFLAKKDQRIKIFEQNHLGQGEARNLGLQHAKGKYIAFLDADDYLSKDFLKKVLVLKYSEKTPELVVFNYEVIDDISKEILNEHIYNSKKQNYGDVIWNKLYLKSFLIENDLFFPKKVKFEDTPFVHTAYVLSKFRAYFPFVGYYYCRNRFGSTTFLLDSNKSKLIFDGLKAFEKYIEDHKWILSDKQEITLYQKLGKGIIYKLALILSSTSFTDSRIKIFEQFLESSKVNEAMRKDPYNYLIYNLTLYSLKLHNMFFFKLINKRAKIL